ncbi:DUF2125 domain-containing protein [Roseibium polysiphoniae]|uniref:DUF2125 domain-containing protein n=1 Tax=Roseibium polysiphoniae TaxID=2571221 RepID=A0ABR9CF59_9HYPH|nr:DUF2125 domain-containing protein [Roseibium polysiphoniae]MBD8877522.1 DUF2125 domain-containing protein [Roseibium polysiphoniae]
MDAGPKRNLKIRYILLAAAVLVTILVWSGGWFYMRGVLRDQIDHQMVRLGQTGQTVSCSDMPIGGFPFRFEVSCAEPALADSRGRTADFKALRTVALVYNPWHVIAEAAGPARFEDPLTGLTGEANWENARSSFIYSTSSIEQIDVVMENVSVAVGGSRPEAGFLADGVSFHLRPLPGALKTLEVFISLNRADSDLLPSLPEPLDAKLHLQLEDGMTLLQGAPIDSLRRSSDGSLPFRLAWASVGNQEMAVTATGDLVLDKGGRFSGKVELSLAGVDQLATFVTSIFPEAAPSLDAMRGAALSFGQQTADENGRSVIRLPLNLRDGQVNLGFLPLGILPPISLGGR